MTQLDDGRISKFQRQIYDWVVELFPTLPVEMEKLIPSSNQRIDIYIEYLNLAIECDGTFHDKPSRFYVKNEMQWKDIVRRDRKKEEDLATHGIKLLRIPYNHKLKSSKDLEILIENIPEPDVEFNPEIFLDYSDYRSNSLDIARESRKKDYSDYIDQNKEDLKKKRKQAYHNFKKGLKF